MRKLGWTGATLGLCLAIAVLSCFVLWGQGPKAEGAPGTNVGIDTDTTGNTLCWGSTGRSSFTGSRKSTPYAATVAIDKLLNEAKEFGIRELEVYLKGPGPGRDAALRVLRESGIKIAMLADVTPIPHNGTRPRKKKHNR